MIAWFFIWRISVTLLELKESEIVIWNSLIWLKSETLIYDFMEVADLITKMLFSMLKVTKIEINDL